LFDDVFADIASSRWVIWSMFGDNCHLDQRWHR
jgi:hypothetical protein